MKLCAAKSRCTRPVLTDHKAELLALEHKLEKRIRRFFWTLAVSNLVTIAVSVAVTLALAHAIWHLRP